MTFPYFINIPNAPDDPADDQPLMQQNTNSIENLIAVDHFGFNVGSSPGGSLNPGGKHEQVQLPVSIVDFPDRIGQGTLYSKATGFGNDAQLFWRFANPAIAPLRLTGNQFTADVAGTVPLMAGMQMTWGQQAIPNTSNPRGPVSFVPAFQTNCFAVFVSLIARASPIPTSSDDTLSVLQGSVTSTGFTYVFNGQAGSYTFFQWIAIGN